MSHPPHRSVHFPVRPSERRCTSPAVEPQPHSSPTPSPAPRHSTSAPLPRHRRRTSQLVQARSAHVYLEPSYPSSDETDFWITPGFGTPVYYAHPYKHREDSAQKMQIVTQPCGKLRLRRKGIAARGRPE